MGNCKIKAEEVQRVAPECQQDGQERAEDAWYLSSKPRLKGDSFVAVKSM